MVSLTLKDFPVYALVSNEEIDLLKGVVEFEDITHKRREWFRIYENTFYLGKRNSYPAVEYNLDKQVARNNREPLHPEQFFRLFNFVENNGINVAHNNLRILPAFSTVQDIDHQLEAMKYIGAYD